jgi:hypothetical protein
LWRQRQSNFVAAEGSCQTKIGIVQHLRFSLAIYI